MKTVNRYLVTGVCALGCLLGAIHWFQTRPIYAQQNTGESDDGIFYVTASINIDDYYDFFADSTIDVEFDYFEEIDYTEVDGMARDDDGDSLGSGSDRGYDYGSAEYDINLSSPVPSGHGYFMQSNGYAYVCYDEQGGDGGDGGNTNCEFQNAGQASAYVYVQYPPPVIQSLSTYSVTQGDINMLTITGNNLVQGSGDQLTLNFSGPTNPFTVASAPTSTNASFSYDFSGYPTGSYQLYVTNGEDLSSEPVTFTVLANTSPILDPDPCAVTTNPRTGYTSIAPTGMAGSGTLSISFSNAAYAMVSPTIAYGPYSTPNSIAANIAALVTKNYFRYGLSAKAFGPNVIYSGNTALGAVTNATTGPSFTTPTSPATSSAVQDACSIANDKSRYYDIEYKAYIPVDNIPGPSPCVVGTMMVPSIRGLDYLGDRSPFTATGFRVRQIDRVSTNPYAGAFEPTPDPSPGKTVNFALPFYVIGGGPPKAAIVSSQFLESDPLNTFPNPGYPWENQCNPPYENNFGYTDTTNMTGSSDSCCQNFVLTKFKGFASDPLEPKIPGLPQFGSIGWELSVAIDTSANTATISGTNTCYPAHQIWVNGRLIYDSQPATNSTFQLTQCLTGVLPRQTADPNTCTNIPLNTNQPCRPQ